MTIPLFQILADGATPVPGADPNLQMWNTVIMFGGIMVLMWLLMIRPQQKKQKELLARISAIKTGDKVITTGGVHGVVSNVKDGPTLVLKVDDNCKLVVDKSAIVTVLAKDAPDAA
jgi:preprotein translocase subunit YajC